MYHQLADADARGDIAMCVPVSAATETIDGTEVDEIAAGAAASVVHRCSYEDSSGSHGADASWIHERGHRIVGPHREV